MTRDQLLVVGLAASAVLIGIGIAALLYGRGSVR